jgi:hypothetical protein
MRKSCLQEKKQKQFKGMTRTEKLKVYDKHGFHYEVILDHKPHFGFSTAFYKGRIIEQVELNKLMEPSSDSDIEWEIYEERFSEWTDDIKVNMIPACTEYFNNKNWE